jgi:hypothetical protein
VSAPPPDRLFGSGRRPGSSSGRFRLVFLSLILLAGCSGGASSLGGRQAAAMGQNVEAGLYTGQVWYAGP